MEKRTSKKLFAGLLALSAGFVLASCDPVVAVPKNYNSPIISSTDGDINLDGNTLGTLYDAITSERNSKIVDDILAEIAEKKFGSYADFLAAASDSSSFIAAHADFFGSDDDKVERFKAFQKDINERISEYFYNEITSGSYNNDLGEFQEEKLYNAHNYELYDMGSKEGITFAHFFADKELTKDNAFDRLNKSLYQVTNGRGYIKEKVYPDILRNKLVENYIYTNNPSSLGRAYGRELSYVKISYEGESKFADALMENFAKAYVEADCEHVNFTVVENAFKGFDPITGENPENYLIAKVSAAEEALLAQSASKGTVEVLAGDVDEYYTHAGIKLVPAGVYYKETKLGKILEEYQKAIEGENQGRFPTEENKSALESFTSDGKSKQYGLLQKLLSLMKEDYTTKGWFVKNGGVTELPSAIRDRLFNIRVANDFDKGVLVNEGAEKPMGSYEYVDGEEAKGKVTRLPYLRNIYGKKVILPSKSLSYGKDPYNYIYHDVDGKAFYICEVLQAPSTAKLQAGQDSDVKKQYTELDKEIYSRQIAKILGTKDSYIKDAYTEELNKFTDWSFHDSSLYDYLKSEYPDLSIFDDD